MLTWLLRGGRRREKGVSLKKKVPNPMIPKRANPAVVTTVPLIPLITPQVPGVTMTIIAPLPIIAPLHTLHTVGTEIERETERETEIATEGSAQDLPPGGILYENWSTVPYDWNACVRRCLLHLSGTHFLTP